jgi:MFS family permease
MQGVATRDSRQGWMLVAAGGVIGCVAIGAMFSLAVFLAPLVQDTGWSRTAVSTAMTLNFLALGVAGFGAGALSDRYGPRTVVVASAVLLGASLIAASRAPSETAFLLIYGLGVGIATGGLVIPMISAVTSWFERHRALAISLVSAGMGMAPATVSPFAAWLVSQTDWRTAQLTIGLLAWAVMLPLAFFVRAAPPDAAEAAPAKDEAQAPLGAAQALRSPQFIVLGLTYFFCCATHSGPIFHTVSYAIACGLPTMAAVSIYSVEGLAGLGGRVALGVLADRVGSKPVLIAGLLVQALAAGSFVYANRLETFYAIAAVFGFAYGGVMPLYAVLAREYFGQRILGTVLGAATMLSAFGMALGPAIGGWIFDTWGRYTGLYLASMGVGLAATALAFGFRAVPAAAKLRRAA